MSQSENDALLDYSHWCRVGSVENGCVRERIAQDDGCDVLVDGLAELLSQKAAQRGAEKMHVVEFEVVNKCQKADDKFFEREGIQRLGWLE